jgi:hypothetical protein
VKYCTIIDVGEFVVEGAGVGAPPDALEGGLEVLVEGGAGFEGRGGPVRALLVAGWQGAVC